MIQTWSVRLTELIAKELNLENSKLNIVSYGLEVIIGGLIKLIFFILVPWMLGVLREFLIAYISFAFLRIVAGGIHCSAFYRCLIVSLTSYLGIAYTVIFIAIIPLPYRELYWGVLVLAFLVVVTRAPVDVEEKPIISPQRRLRLKILSCFHVVIFFLLSLLWNPESTIYLASGLAILFQVFTLTDSGAKFFKFIDQII